MIKEDIDKMHNATLESILQKIENKYLTDSNIYKIILNTNKTNKVYLDMIDSIHQNVITSLKYKQYKRARRFLIALDFLCNKCFK